MIKTPLTNKAVASVEQYQLEVDALRMRASQARSALSQNKSALLSSKSALFAIFATGTYLGSRPKVVKVADPKLADKKPFPLVSLLNTALSLFALKQKAQLLSGTRKKANTSNVPTKNSKE